MEACFRADQRQTQANHAGIRREHANREKNTKQMRGTPRSGTGGRPQRREMVVQHLQQTRTHHEYCLRVMEM